MAGSLLQTKFYVPPQRPKLVLRPQLLAKLNAGLGNGRTFSHRLTIVSAPAGFGKTTLVTNWLNHLEQSEIGAAIVTGWLSLDENDNDLRRFITYLVAAVQAIEWQDGRVIGEELLAALQSSRPPDDAAILPAFLNELVTIGQPLILVLDDYHVIKEVAIHDWLAQLIDYLPSQVQLVLTSREDPPLPLARWRVRGQLTEVRLADLRFSVGETADFFRQTMGLLLEDEIIGQLEDRTEGWVAALQLAALIIQSPGNIEGEGTVEQLVADFSGSDRHVAGYLLEEVLHRQPPEQQQFLLETAVLERFNGVVCDYLTGRNGSREMLETLHQRNLFVIPLDNRGEWYRYHHLFAQLLRHRLEQRQTAEQRAERHRKARDWFQANNFMEEAIYHALQAGDSIWVADYLCQFTPTQFWEGTLAASFKNWANQLPVTLINNNPRLSLLVMWASLITTDLRDVEERLEMVAAVPNLEEGLQAEVYLMQAIFLRNRGESEAALQQVSKALKILPEADETMRTIAYMQLVSACLNLGHLERAYDVSRFVYDSVDTQKMSGLNMLVSAAQMLSIILRSKAQVYEAFQTIQHSIDIVNKRSKGFFPMIGLLYSELGRIYYEWNELDKAADYCNQTIELALRTGISDLLFPSYFLDAQLARREGDLKRLAERIKWFKEVTNRSDLSEMIRVANYIEAAFQLEIGDVDSAVRWANASGLQLDDQPTYEQFGVYDIFTRIYVAQIQTQADSSILIANQLFEMIDRLMALAEDANDVYSQIVQIILKAILLNKQGRLEDSTTAMAQAIRLAEPGTMIRIFLDIGPTVYSLIRGMVLDGVGETAEIAIYAKQLHQACETEWGPYSPDLDTITNPILDPLTEREREVLACITAGLTNREIEEHLVISRNTVRTHIKNLYSKLGVNGREEAIEQAQLLGLGR